MVQENSLKKYDSIVIVGPTASGKTALAIYIAQKIGGEIVSCDSMQIYQDMDIGTAKATADEKKMAVHHMIDIVSPKCPYSVSDYVIDAKACINDIWQRGKTPIICGGTGFYVDAIINGGEMRQSYDIKIREKLMSECEKNGIQYMYDKLKSIDPISAEKINVNDKKRVIRALEIYENTGIVRSSQSMQNSNQSFLHPIIFNIVMDRDVLYKRINDRVDYMVKNGLIDETKKLLDMGLDTSYQSMASIGYKEIVPYIKGEITLDKAVEDLKQATRRYAKRQITWFKKRPKDSIAIDLTNGLDDKAKLQICSILEQK